eukprot:CAMPEP_0179457314 /NCGR_PEP_ID=MMETSP0799-20121207/41120_1 /TAXON_ID=46947 /ORGANISM="Geminigera cryophila, Strain CCMP2564" /LENGTH=62 /DNA_ID=CAMNT_0021257953 /DNA_START=47 /DNA_END=235 /DNA_ORIENTATION=+
MFFGFNTFDPRNSPAVSSDQESYKSAFTASALGVKKNKYAGDGKNLAKAMNIFDESFGGSHH